MASLLDHLPLISLSILIHLGVPVGPVVPSRIILGLVGVVISSIRVIALCLHWLLNLSFLRLLGVQGRVLIPSVLLRLHWGAADCHALTLERQWTVVLGIAHSSLWIRVHHGL